MTASSGGRRINLHLHLHLLLWCQSVRGQDYGKEGSLLVGQYSSPITAATDSSGVQFKAQLWVWTVPARDTETDQ